MFKQSTLTTAGVALAIMALATAALAGDFHHGGTLNCSDCHIMHYSQSHGYNPDGTGVFAIPGTGGPYDYLLRNDINALCMSCHDGLGWAPDVVEGHANGYVRQAGALNIVGGNGQYPPPTGHTLGITDEAPGSEPPWSPDPDHGLTCVNCHQPHGSGPGPGWNSYRNLGGYGTGSGMAPGITYAWETNDLGKDVFEDMAGGTLEQHYGVGSITFNEPDQTTSAYANFCKSCHTDFHGDVGGVEIGGGAEPFHRHPAGGVDIGASGGGHSSMGVFTGHDNQVQVMSPSGQRAGGYEGTDTELTQSCMSCHKSHGNQNAFGLIFMSGTGTITEEGDDGATVRHLCKQCHVQGG